MIFAALILVLSCGNICWKNPALLPKPTVRGEVMNEAIILTAETGVVLTFNGSELQIRSVSCKLDLSFLDWVSILFCLDSHFHFM